MQEIAIGNPERTVRHWLNSLACRGCVKVFEEARGRKPATYQLTGKAPTDDVLPTPEAIGMG